MKLLKEPFESIKIKVDNDKIKIHVFEEVNKWGYRADLNHIDVSQVTDFYGLFFSRSYLDFLRYVLNYEEYQECIFRIECIKPIRFNGDISGWDMGNARVISFMFTGSEFNGDISNWNTENLEYMHLTFADSKFEGDISKWNTNKLKQASLLFANSNFKGDLDSWNLENLENKKYFWAFTDKWEVENQISCLKVFKSDEDLEKSLKYFDWLRNGNVILRERFKTAIDHFDGDDKYLDLLKGVIYEK